MATIRVNSEVMREKAETFSTVSTSIKNFRDEMKTEVDSLKSTWEGGAAEALINKFSDLAARFEDICDTINQYAEFLNKAADSYDSTESSAIRGAEGQKS